MDYFRKKQDSECTIAGLYDLSETIGKGHFAVVKLAKHVFTGEKVAVKVIDKTKLDPISRDHLFQEVRCMKLVQHPHIVRLYEVIDTQTKLYLILELGDGDMYDYIMNNHDRGLDIETARMYFTQILEAISYCHDLHVVHRDLKPENVIFFEKLGIVKLTDFGFSNRFEPDTKLDTSCGSLAYSAPEILLGDSYDAPAVDVWSLGVLLYMLVCGDPPFQEANDSETLTMIMDCKYRIPPHIPPHCANLISSMLRREPKERISLRSIVHHPWMTQSGRKCCDNSSCVALVGREHLASEDHELIIQKMVEGNIASRNEILRALESDEYSNVTATFYLLAERKLKRQHADLRPPVTRNRPATVPWPPSERVQLEPSPKSAPYDQPDSVFSHENTFPAYTAPGIGLQTDSLTLEHQQRKFSLIDEVDEEESDCEDALNHNVLSVKETKSSTWGDHSKYQQKSSNTMHHSGTGVSLVSSDFEQSLSNMSLKRPATASPSNAPRSLRTVTSSPQLLPLKQIHEEQEIVSGDEDALSTHSQTSTVRLRHSSLSMASPEVARKLLSKKKLIKHKTQSGSDTSDNDDDKHSSRDRDSIPNITNTLNLPHKRKDSGNSSDNDGPPASGGGGGSTGHASANSKSANSSNRDSGSKSSPCAKKKYGGGSGGNSRASSAAATSGLVVTGTAYVTAPCATDALKSDSTSSYKSTMTQISENNGSSNGVNRKSNSNNNGKELSDNSLRVLANKFVDSSLARLSNFSLASQTSSISSRSSAKYSSNTTPRSSLRKSKDGKFSKSRLMQNLKMDFSELSDREMTDSDCGSLHNSLRIKFSTTGTGSNKEYSVITEEQTSQIHSPGAKKTTECCLVM